MIGAHGLALSGRLEPTDLMLEPGQMVALIGPNGGGKTSLLRALAGHEDAAGDVRIDGQILAEAGPNRSRLVAMMGASRELAWAIPVRSLLRLGNEQVSAAYFDLLIEQFELAALADRPANRLSTGERARVLMARALAGDARLILLDEPLSNLDPYWVLRFVAAVRERADAGAAVVCALHDLSQADRFDRLLLIAGGKVVGDGAPANILGSREFGEVFRVEADGPRWRIIPSADSQSSR